MQIGIHLPHKSPSQQRCLLSDIFLLSCRQLTYRSHTITITSLCVVPPLPAADNW